MNRIKMDDNIEEESMLKAADFARSRRTDDVRRRSKFHHDVTENSTQTNSLNPSQNSTISRDWFLWKQTTLLCSLTFASVLGTITQIKQMMSVGSNHKNYSLLLCMMLSSLLLQCFVAMLLLILTHKEPDWLRDIYRGTILMQRTINVVMAAVFVVSLLTIFQFVFMS